MTRLRKLFAVLFLVASSAPAWSISSELHGLLVEIVGEMEVNTAQMPPNDGCTIAMWQRATTTLRNQVSTPDFDLFDQGNPEVIDESYGLFQCRDRLQASFHKPTDDQPRSYVDITLTTNCSCNPGSARDVRSGVIKFRVPVRVRKDFLGKTRYDAQPVQRYEMDVQCCRTERKDYRAYDSSGRRVAVKRPLAAAALAERREAQQQAAAAQREQRQREQEQRQQEIEDRRQQQQRERESQQREREARERALQRAREHQARVCRECEAIKAAIDQNEADKAAKEQEIARLQGEIEAKRTERENVRQRIRRIKRQLNSLSTGFSGSIFDPATGIRTEGWQNPDGSMSFRSVGPDGRVIEEWSHDPAKKKKRRDRLNQQMADARAEEQRLSGEIGQLSIAIQRARNWIHYLNGEIATLYERLRECLRRCRQAADALPKHLALPVPDYPIPSQEELDRLARVERRPAQKPADEPATGGGDAGQTGQTGQAAQAGPAAPGGCSKEALTTPVLVGETKEFKGAYKAMEQAAEGMAKRALGGLLGGFGSVGGGIGSGGTGGLPVDDSGPSGPPTTDDPIPHSAKTVFRDAVNGVEIAVGAQMTDDGVLVSSEILEAPGKGTFHGVVAQDDDCRLRYPVGRYLYEVWSEWSLQVWWTKDTYVNNELVKHEEGEEFSAGSELLGSGSYTLFNEETALSAPLWKGFGFNGPFAGAKGIGITFNYAWNDLQDGGRDVAVHVTTDKDGKVMTVPFAFTLKLDATGNTVQIKDLDAEDELPVQSGQEAEPAVGQDWQPKGLHLLGGTPANLYGVETNAHQGDANAAARHAFEYNKALPVSTRLSKAAQAAADLAVKAGESPDEVGRVAGNAILTIPRYRKKGAFGFYSLTHLTDAIQAAAEQASRAGGSPRDVGKAAGLVQFEDYLEWEEEFDGPLRREFVPLAGGIQLDDWNDADAKGGKDDDVDSSIFNQAATSAGTTILNRGGSTEQAAQAIGVATYTSAFGNPDKGDSDHKIRGPNPVSDAAELAVSILTEWHKQQDKTLTATQIGVAVGVATKAAGASNREAVEHAAHAAEQAGASAAEIESVRVSVAVD